MEGNHRLLSHGFRFRGEGKNPFSTFTTFTTFTGWRGFVNVVNIVNVSRDRPTCAKKGKGDQMGRSYEGPYPLREPTFSRRDAASQMFKGMNLVEMLAAHYDMEHHLFENGEFRKR